jgi:hypothetical protein
VIAKQAAKSGPDDIDPVFHAAATGARDPGPAGGRRDRVGDLFFHAIALV